MLFRLLARRLRILFSVARRARLIAWLAPPRRWYDAALFLARVQWTVCRCIWWRPDITLRNAVYLDLLLLELGKLGNYPLRWRCEGAERLPRTQVEGTEQTSVLYCTSHVPLFAVQSRVLFELGAAPSMVIALDAAIGADGCYPIPGVSTRIPAIPPGAFALGRLRRELQAGKVVGSLMDQFPGGPLRPQLFRLTGKVPTRPLFLFSELDTDGAVKLTVMEPPFPRPETDEAVQANLQAYDAVRQRILNEHIGTKAANWLRSLHLSPDEQAVPHPWQ